MQIEKYTAAGNLSDDLVSQIRTMIIDGRLTQGQRINEVHLSAAIGVSRTPLREALTQLRAEGAVEAIPRRGFFVKAMTIEEVENIYPIRALLDPEALRLSGIPSSDQMQYLQQLNQMILLEKEPFNIIALDDTWHLTLVKHCPNTTILDLIRQFMLRTRRYEYGLMKSYSHVETAIDTHVEIMTALNDGDLDSACLILKKNMQQGKTPIIKWLQERSN